jgi:hypothetical protein
METRLQALEEKVTRLSERVDQLEQKLVALPIHSFSPAWPAGEPHLQEVPFAGVEMTRWLTFLGRSCVVLGGAFLIRALTDSRTLPSGVGVVLGMIFAVAWVFFSHRAGASGATLSAGFHGVTAALIAYPLVLETTTRLGAMSSLVAALTLMGFTALLLMVSWRDRLGWLAWIGVLSCLLTTIILLRATPARAEFTGVLLVLAATTFWLGDRPRWGGLRWLPALVLDLVILRAVLTSTPPVLVYSLALACLSLALVFSRTAALARPVGAFEVLQTLAGLVIGLAGALRVSVESGHGSGAVAGGVLAASLLALFFAAWVVPRRGNRDLDFLFYASVSLGLLSFGVALLTAGDLRGVLWSTLALLTALLGRRRHPGALWSFAALLALGAAFTTGLIRGVWQALAGRDPVPWLAMSPGSVMVLGLIVLTYLATVPPLRPSLARLTTWASPRLPAAVLLLLGSAGLATLVLRASRPFTPDLARLATARTLVAVAVALSLALMRRRVACPELKWIAYLALGLGGVALVIQGLPSGQPLLLLISFVLYGAGLILVPRLIPPGRDPANPSGGAQRASVGTRS